MFTLPDQWKAPKGKEILAATGHRPDKLLGYSTKAANTLCKFAISYLEEKLAENQDIHLISGMALGWDTAWAKAALELDIPVTLAIPFVGQEKWWFKSSQDEYTSLLDKVPTRQVVVVSPGGYAPWKMEVRNRWMVDNCTTLIALFDGTPGGTMNCITYANKKDKPWINLWDRLSPLR